MSSAQMLLEPPADQCRDLLESAGLFEQMRGPRNDRQLLLTTHFSQRFAVELEHDGISASDNKKRRGFDACQGGTGKVGTPASGDNRRDMIRQLGCGNQSGCSAGT